MKITVRVDVENSDAFLFKDVANRSLSLQLVKGGSKNKADPKEAVVDHSSWEIDSDNFDRFLLIASFTHPADPTKPILNVQQSYKFDASLGVCVETPDDAKPRAFDQHAHPLLEATTTTSAGASNLRIKVKTGVVDLTDAIVAWQGAVFDVSIYSLDHARKTADPDGVEVRHLGVLQPWPDGKGGTTMSLFHYVVAIPKLSKSSTTNPGVLLHYGPTMTNPQLGKDANKNAQGVRDFYDSVCRYLTPPALEAGSATEILQFFGPSKEDPTGGWPNCMLARMLGKSNKNVILLMTWAFWPHLNAAQIQGALNLMWAEGWINAPVNSGVALGRLGIAGYSAGGGSSMDGIHFHASRLSEVFLFDPTMRQDKEPDTIVQTRMNYVTSWFIDQSKDKTKRLHFTSGVFEFGKLTQMKNAVQSVATSSNFFFLPSRISGDYYGGAHWDKADPDWVTGSAHFTVDAKTRAADGANFVWRCHQWPVFGGEGAATMKRTDPAFRTYMGQHLANSGF